MKTRIIKLTILAALTVTSLNGFAEDIDKATKSETAKTEKVKGEGKAKLKAAFKRIPEFQTWTFRPYWGSNMGVTTSFGVPEETVGINSAPFQYNYIFGCDVTYRFNEKLGVATGLRFERKGGNSSVEMKNYLTTVTLVGEGTPTYGYFTGSVDTKCSINYLTVPILGVYNINPKMDVRAGVYFSYAVTRKYQCTSYDGKIRESPLVPATGVDNSRSDFSNGINRFDMGIQAGVVMALTDKLDVNFDLNWGLINVLDAPESGMTKKVFNIYVSCGLGWRF